MRVSRRRLLRLAADAAALPAVSRIAWAQAYPVRPVRMVLGLAPGGSVDIVARMIGQWLSERLGKPFGIEKRPGAAGDIATEAVGPPPAHRLPPPLCPPPNAIYAALSPNVDFNL